ncbi:hypothetical protein GCM10010298_09180 [Streptomyces microflavus]|uniref:Uncharacterized protein n=1 Tax=Streptomyces microflavus TaxID=1919 RepID=A0A7J0CLZ7_STRMI|nr:hypothetical protein Smic_18740 [Streptomyces microflavus]GGX47695.1 hypothetical protein GCM10010298_09180 [Streptomyces microflavus]
MVGVVEEEHQVTEADEGVGAVPGAGQGLGVAVHIADHVDPGGTLCARRRPVRFAASHADHPKAPAPARVEAGEPAGPAVTSKSSCRWTTVRERAIYLCDA